MNSRLLLPVPDYANKIQIAGVGSKITHYTMPEYGVVIGNMDGSAQGDVTVNGDIAVIGGNDSGNEGPFYFQVAKGDIVASSVATRGAFFVPYKYISVVL